MNIRPKDWYSEDYFYPKKRHYTDEFGVVREYFGPSKEWAGFGNIANFIRNNFPGVLTITDIGCSAGSFVDHSIVLGFDTIGVDISKFAVDNCVGRSVGRLSVADITTDSPVRKSNMAVAFDLMEHIYQKDLEKAIQYIRESIINGGVFFACIATARHENELWQHTSENDEVPNNKTWLAVSGHVNIKWFEDWISIFNKYGFTPDYNMMYKFQLWRTRNELKDTESWSIRNVYIGRI